MSQAGTKIAAFAKSQTTETLIDSLKQLNRDYRPEAIVASTYVTRELEARMSEADFLKLMEWCEADMMAA